MIQYEGKEMKQTCLLGISYEISQVIIKVMHISFKPHSSFGKGSVSCV